MQDHNGSEGRGTMEDDVMKTTVEMREDNNGDGGDMG